MVNKVIKINVKVSYLEVTLWKNIGTYIDTVKYKKVHKQESFLKMTHRQRLKLRIQTCIYKERRF